jgi:hypothetical protein
MVASSKVKSCTAGTSMFATKSPNPANGYRDMLLATGLEKDYLGCRKAVSRRDTTTLS